MCERCIGPGGVELDGKVASFQGRKFWLQKTGRYFSSGGGVGAKRFGGEYLLHRAVWHFYFGEIPAGMVVHHSNGNWEDNCPSNLEIIDKSKHSREHMLERLKDPEFSRKNEISRKKAVSKAPEWHRSNEGREWHRAHGKETASRCFLPRDRECPDCKSTFSARCNNRKTRCPACRKKALAPSKGVTP